jgi:hypothetical protein
MPVNSIDWAIDGEYINEVIELSSFPFRFLLWFFGLEPLSYWNWQKCFIFMNL